MAARLSTYRAKRDFTKTAEPSGSQATPRSKRRRFVIQKHAARRLHYDLRLELDGVFKSWAVTRGPSADPADKRLAVEVEDHPLDYGDFEGTIPHGQYGGGTVQLWDRGYWDPIGSGSPEESLRAGELKFKLEGECLHGSWVLVRMRRDRSGGKRINWLLIKHRDEFAADPAGAEALLAQDVSVASGRTMAQIAAGRRPGPKPFMLAGRRSGPADAVWSSGAEAAAKSAPAPKTLAAPKTPLAVKAPALPRGARKVSRMPRFVEPQLCKLLERPPSGGGWLHEIKFDGYRMQLRVDDGAAVLRTRKGLDWTEKFSAVATAASSLPPCIVDGEVVALNHAGVPNFSALQAAIAEHRSQELVYFVFDLLFLDGQDLRGLPLLERKRLLARLIEPLKSERIHYVEHLQTQADAVLKSACAIGLEGIISKRADAPYTSDRRGTWIKLKCRPGQEVVIGGWTNEGSSVRSLLVGVYRRRRLIYVGRVGTGFGREASRLLAPQLRALSVDQSPFEGDNAPRQERNVLWVKPQLVAEIEFAGWTHDGNVRHGAFKGLRADKPASEVRTQSPAPVATDDPQQSLQQSARQRNARRPSAAVAKVNAARRGGAGVQRSLPASASPANVVMGVTISQPDKALWPDAGDRLPVSKLDLARYYEAVGEWMLPHIRGRPCSLVRAPDGIGAQHFFQRHAIPGTSSLIELVSVSGDRKPYVQIDRVEALAAVAQIATLELHPWNCESFQPDVPGRLVFDLDPAPEVSFDEVVKAALELRERLEALGLVTFCKTTGGKGLHVVTPLKVDARQKIDWPLAKAFAQGVCMHMAADSPSRYLISMAKKQRTGRIFLDYLRNDRMATAVAPLSPRARAGAAVSMPLTWSQVRPGLAATRFTVRTAAALLARSRAWAQYADAPRPLKGAIKRLTAPMS
jgi:bifunctional non-homologous end joining protein LigD